MSSPSTSEEPAHPVALAETLLQLVSSIYGPPGSSQDGTSGGTWQTDDTIDSYKSRIRVQSLCDKLVRTVLGPLQYTILLAESCHESAAIRLITSLRVADIIGDNTLSLSELSEKTEVDTQYLSVAMGCLIAHGYFEEVGGFGTRQYANNASSEYLKVGVPDTISDAIGFVCGDGLKASSYLLEAVQAPAPGPQKERLPAINLAFGFEGTVFDWMASPEQAWRGQRLGRAMQQLHRVVNGKLSTDYKWNALTSPIVDIGGGIGSLEMTLLEEKQNEQLKFTVFDIPKTIENAKKVWAAKPAALASCVSFAAGNFLASSPDETKIPKGQPTYVIRHVLHDWTDDQVITILKNVRTAMLAANPDAPGAKVEPKLVMSELLLQPDSPRFVRCTSVQLMALNNGLIRTLGEMVKLVESAGFKIEKVHELRAVDSVIEAYPLP